MTSPFRSTLGVASRRRTRPVVERATFVIVSLGTVRCALPVECVDRVLRATAHGEPPVWDGHPLAWADLGAAAPSRATEWPDTSVHRVLVVRDDRGGSTGGGYWAVPVHAVHEVYAVEAALLVPWGTDPNAEAHAYAALPGLTVRATFERHGHLVGVIDVPRSLTPRP